ncbi:MAG: hypothetical protein OER86_04710 [Phycisphaerae bacterium]|nr:hypothetical protein [Phycisphaerae bacterium]
MNRPRLALPLALTALALLPACGAYELSGKVIEGAASSVQVVAPDDRRLTAPGLGGILVQATIDPQSLGRKSLAPAVSSADGSFNIGVEEFGAGTLEYEISVVARHERFQPSFQILPLPGRGRVLLITMTRGRDHDIDPHDPLQPWRNLSAPPPKLN